MLKAAGRVELAPLEVFDQGIAEDAVPSIEVGQLLHSLPQPREEAGDAQKSTAGAAVLAVRAGDRDGGSASMLGLPADGLEQQRSAGHRLAMLIGVGQADEQVPPIGGEGDDAMNWQRLTSWVVKPPQLHWFFNSSKLFWASPRLR